MSMLFVRNYDAWSEIGAFFPEDGFRLQERCENSPTVATQKTIKGFWGTIGGTKLVLFRDDCLYLTVNAKKFMFSGVTISTRDIKTWKKGWAIKQMRHITIQDVTGITIFDTNYDEIADTFEFDFTPCGSNEDFDFGLFLENLSKDKNRQQRLFTDRF